MNELVLTHIAEGVATVTMNRPEAFDALDGGLMDAFVASIGRCSVDSKIRTIIVTGAGKAFCGGGDLKWSMSAPGGASAALHDLAGQFHLAITEIRRMAKPVIAAVNGVAAGGGFSLALACDFRVLASTAVLKQAYTSAGLSLDGGGTFALPRLVGLARAMEIIAFDAPISAKQALAWGLATKVVAPEQLLSAATTWPARLHVVPCIHTVSPSDYSPIHGIPRSKPNWSGSAKAWPRARPMPMDTKDCVRSWKSAGPRSDDSFNGPWPERCHGG